MDVASQQRGMCSSERNSSCAHNKKRSRSPIQQLSQLGPDVLDSRHGAVSQTVKSSHAAQQAVDYTEILHQAWQGSIQLSMPLLDGLPTASLPRRAHVAVTSGCSLGEGDHTIATPATAASAAVAIAAAANDDANVAISTVNADSSRVTVSAPSTIAVRLDEQDAFVLQSLLPKVILTAALPMSQLLALHASLIRVTDAVCHSLSGTDCTGTDTGTGSAIDGGPAQPVDASVEGNPSHSSPTPTGTSPRPLSGCGELGQWGSGGAHSVEVPASVARPRRGTSTGSAMDDGPAQSVDACEHAPACSVDVPASVARPRRKPNVYERFAAYPAPPPRVLKAWVRDAPVTALSAKARILPSDFTP